MLGKNNTRLFLLLTVAAGAVLTAVHLNFQELLSQGDHGRDLYAAQEILKGKLPYKDFWWVYGPLMPYYYAVFLKVFGGTIPSVLAGYAVLKIIAGVFFYLAASVLMAPSIAFLAACWFMQGQQDFFFTFNHIGGIALEMFICWRLFAYVATNNQRHAWATLPAILLYALTKINFGLAALLITFLSVAGIDFLRKNKLNADKKKFYAILLVGLTLLIIFMYWVFLKDLPFYQIRQCMPYFGDDQPHHYPPSVTIPYYFMQHWLTFVHSPVNMGLGLILHGATLAAAWLLFSRRFAGEKARTFVLCLAVTGLFFIINFHEFVVSGVWYRTFWSLPFLFLFHFMAMSAAFQFIPAWVRRCLLAVFGSLLILGLVADTMGTAQRKTPPSFLDTPRGKVFLGNEPAWTDTVLATTEYLNKNLTPNELFFALPYDCLYYYLTGKSSPTRQLIFFDHIKVPQVQEIETIRDLENKKVNYVVMSNRIASSETGMGIFGKTYCPLLARYIEENFAPVARQGGNWQAEPGWANNHGVIIFKRKETAVK